MTFVHDMTNLFSKRLCRIVFVNNREAAAGLADKITVKYPEYITETSELFCSYKQVGPFKLKNKKHLWELVRQTEMVQKLRKATDQTSTYAMIEDELTAIDLLSVQYRRPRALSRFHKYRASVLCDLLNGKLHFLLNDSAFDDPEDDVQTRIYRKKGHLTIAQYMKRYMHFESARRELIWITDLTVHEMLDLLGAGEYRSDFYGFYTVVEGRVVALDKTEIVRTYESQNGVDLPPLNGNNTLDQFDEDSFSDMLLEEHLPLPERRKSKALQEVWELAIKKYSQAELSVLQAAPVQSGYYIFALLQAGQISWSSLFRSQRTGSIYKLLIMPVDMTYEILQSRLADGDQTGNTGYVENICRESGYDPDLVRNYSVPSGSLPIEEAAKRKISVGDSGSFTCVGFVALPLDGQTTQDIQMNDVWVAINESGS